MDPALTSQSYAHLLLRTFLGSFLGAEGGVILALRKTACLDTPIHRVLSPGFGHVVVANTDSGPVSFFNLHVHPHWSVQVRSRFLHAHETSFLLFLSRCPS